MSTSAFGVQHAGPVSKRYVAVTRNARRALADLPPGFKHTAKADNFGGRLNVRTGAKSENPKAMHVDTFGTGSRFSGSGRARRIARDARHRAS